MTAGLSSPRGSNIDAVVARTFIFYSLWIFVVWLCVVMFLTWRLSVFRFHSNPSSCVGTYFVEACMNDREKDCFYPSCDFTRFLWSCPLYILMNLWNWTLSSGSRSSLRSIACRLRYAERREDTRCLRSNFVDRLKINLPSCCWVLCVMKC